ncbi:MAG: hypothetical protein AUJ32_00530 [Parcubacteria group bacterium CG1_02_40_82]|nr:MAG: hypothetical protein AUJ32_00530 [Parcubacteria group bacterium CG1_02_40_82]
MKIVKTPIKKSELAEIAKEEFGDIVKAVVDTEQEIMAIGGELHADEEVLLTEKESSKRENTWGINIYPKKAGEDFIEFDSMVNLKPNFGNRLRGVENSEVQNKIRGIVKKLIIE